MRIKFLIFIFLPLLKLVNCISKIKLVKCISTIKLVKCILIIIYSAIQKNYINRYIIQKLEYMVYKLRCIIQKLRFINTQVDSISQLANELVQTYKCKCNIALYVMIYEIYLQFITVTYKSIYIFSRKKDGFIHIFVVCVKIFILLFIYCTTLSMYLDTFYIGGYTTIIQCQRPVHLRKSSRAMFILVDLDLPEYMNKSTFPIQCYLYDR